ncbi:FKBP-type peptidyl-prolyl cis-trans isomerase [Opitutus terrae]|uniref:Peptidyl-prolyl cis-trans isomerase n=1 Tax=Opitutus terrae (strain DSM 11246 / JCM 15787 / PB90-1) TaxID=452637 RepID=B1ZQJ9_OPITP|nr:FKBP-type peptidyl-prolyl cis-trans isomerase [Opitutus terrae]ACB75608.1 peptidylprolyl isomerase FKBP-type [Opitutus terrae PB90-1]
MSPEAIAVSAPTCAGCRRRHRALLLLVGCAASALATEPVEPSTATADPALRAYGAVGSAVATNLNIPALHWSEAQFEAFLDGFRAAYAGRALPLDERARELLDEIGHHVAASGAPRPAPAADPLASYLRSLKHELTLQESASGVLYRMDQAGAGPRPRAVDTVVINIAAKGPDGTTALPALSGQGTRVEVAALLPGLAEAVQMLALGGKIFVVLPPALSFGTAEWPAGVPAGAPLIFEIELLDIIAAASP